jgi:hypothetical protein
MLFNLIMTAKVVTGSREIAAPADRIFELIADPSQQPRWELEPVDDARTLVTHTYDWTQLTDEKRMPRARDTTADRLQASLDRLAELAERS